MKLNIFYTFLFVCGALCAAFDVSKASNTTLAVTTPPVTTVTTPQVTNGSTTNHTAASSTIVTQTGAATTANPRPTQCLPDRWCVTYEDGNENEFCIIMQADIFVTIITRENKTEISINQSSPNSGSCRRGNTSESIQVSDGSGLTMTWKFMQNSDAKFFNLTSVDVSYRNASVTHGVSDDWMDKIDSSRMFQCNANETLLNTNDTSGNVTFVVTVKSLKLLAFQNTTTSDFTNLPYTSCAADTNVSNLVPIIVGACLGGLIVIVLIAYLVGRRRSRRGYESV